MSQKKPARRGTLEYVRPQPDTSFTLDACPGHTFRFRHPNLDDEAWIKEVFERELGEIFSPGSEVNTNDLARIWFRFLDENSKILFVPEKLTVKDEETGDEKEVLVTSWKKFQRAIGMGVETVIVASAFGKALAASRPVSDLPAEIKKKLAENQKAEKEKSNPESTGKTSSTP